MGARGCTLQPYEGAGGVNAAPGVLLQEDVDTFMQLAENSSAEVVLKRFEEMYNKYRYMESSLTQKKRRRVTPPHILLCDVC